MLKFVAVYLHLMLSIILVLVEGFASIIVVNICDQLSKGAVFCEQFREGLKISQLRSQLKFKQ